MRLPRLIPALAVLLTVHLLPAYSQEPRPQTQALDTFTVSMALSGIGDRTRSLNGIDGGPSSGGSNWLVVVARSETYQVGIQIDARTIGFTGDCDSLDQISTTDFFRAIVDTSLASAAAHGYITCVDSAVVWLPSSVQRSGSGSVTRFTPCTDCMCATLSLPLCNSGLPLKEEMSGVNGREGTTTLGTCESLCDISQSIGTLE